MKANPIPMQPLPEPIYGDEPGSFAEYSISVRFKNTARKVIAENRLSSPAEEAIRQLISEIPQGMLRPIQDGAPDNPGWAEQMAPYIGMNWLEPPWLVTETYFYRRILEASGYFTNGDGFERDPFIQQKEDGLKSSPQALLQLARQLESWLQSAVANQSALQTAISQSLWGNQADLSMWPSGSQDAPQHTDAEARSRHQLVDDSAAIASYLIAAPARSRLEIFADNAGMELIFDLSLVDFLLSAGIVSQVRMHLKIYPTYVSDAMIKDVRHSLDFLGDHAEAPIRAFGRRLQAHLTAQRLVLFAHPYWTSTRAAWDMPPDLVEQLAGARLLISKGDANYRRMLGDRHWPAETPLERILSYLPSPLAALRVMKSELVAGLKTGQAERTRQQDPDWLVDGRWGLIQLVQK